LKVKIVKPCVNQDTKKRLEPGDVVNDFSAFELGRHFAEGNAIPIRESMERAVDTPAETRTKRRRKPRQ